MKTNKFFGMAAIMCGIAFTFTSCSEVEDNPVPGTTPQTVVISFENQTLGADGYWCGDETGTKFDNWGAEAYSCVYTESGATFTANYTPAWGSWSGFAISNRTATTYKDMTPDQFNNAVGGAHTGNNFAVVYTFGESIGLSGNGCVVKGFYYTNDAWTVDAILNGDGMSPGKFEANDWLKCTVTGTRADGSTASVDIMLAENGNYVKDWQWADLSSLGRVTALSFAFDGTKKNDWGLTTPTYICVDDIQVEVER